MLNKDRVPVQGDPHVSLMLCGERHPEPLCCLSVGMNTDDLFR